LLSAGFPENWWCSKINAKSNEENQSTSIAQYMDWHQGISEAVGLRPVHWIKLTRGQANMETEWEGLLLL
jgi:hypothetical protein